MRCARSLTAINQPRDARRDRRALRRRLRRRRQRRAAVELGLSTMWLHLGDRAASDRYLDLAARDPLRRSALFDCQVRQRLVMRHLLDGRWADAAAEIDEVRARGAHDPNIRLGCDCPGELAATRDEVTSRPATVATSERAERQPGLVAGAGGAGVGRRRGRPPRRRPRPARPAGRRRLRRRPGGSGWPCWRSATWRGRRSRSTPASTRPRCAGCSARTRASWRSSAPASYVLGGDRPPARRARRPRRRPRRAPTRCSPPRSPRSTPCGRRRSPARTRHWWGRARLRRGDRAGAAAAAGRRRGRRPTELAMAGLVAAARRLVGAPDDARVRPGGWAVAATIWSRIDWSGIGRVDRRQLRG